MLGLIRGLPQRMRARSSTMSVRKALKRSSATSIPVQERFEAVRMPHPFPYRKDLRRSDATSISVQERFHRKRQKWKFSFKVELPFLCCNSFCHNLSTGSYTTLPRARTLRRRARSLLSRPQRQCGMREASVILPYTVCGTVRLCRRRRTLHPR